MNKCNQCRSLFERCSTKEIPHYEVDTRIYETICVCPECGSEDFEEVTVCKGCHQNYIKSSEDYCQHCYNDVSLWVNKLADWKGLPYKDAEDLIESYLAR